MTSPCFNAETHSDCPRRHGGCAIDCPEWAKYCVERDKEYTKRAENNETNFVVGKTLSNRTAKKLSNVIHDRGRKRKIR